MYRANFIVLTLAAALAVGCTASKKHPAPTTQLAQSDTQSEWTESADATATGTTESAWNDSQWSQPTSEESSAAKQFAGKWQLAIPRKNQKPATITITDSGRIEINAGETLSGKYTIQGSYLLILTNDEQLRPLAWRINTPDSLTVVRSPDFGDSRDYIGVTMVRAPQTVANASDSNDDAATDSDTNSAASSAESFADTEASLEAADGK